LFTIEIKPFEKKTFNSNPFSTMPNFGEKTKIQKLTLLADLVTPPPNNFDLASAFDIEEKEGDKPPF
jgi:hypothetical protein